MAREFLNWAKENNLIKSVDEAFKEYPPEEEWHKGKLTYLIAEDEKSDDINVGDIVYVENFKYLNNKERENHLFVIIEKDYTMVSLEYFGLLIYSYLLKEDKENKLIAKTDYLYKITKDMISYKLSSVSKEKVEFFKECMRKNLKEQEKIKNYIKREKTLIEKEYELLEEISKYRKEKHLTQRELAKILKIKQPMLAKIEKSKNSPQLNTLLKILDSLGYTVEFVKK